MSDLESALKELGSSVEWKENPKLSLAEARAVLDEIAGLRRRVEEAERAIDAALKLAHEWGPPHWKRGENKSVGVCNDTAHYVTKPLHEYRDRQAASPPPPAVGDDGVSLIAAERRRQVEAEGWTPEHDDRHKNGEMAISGAAYALLAAHMEGVAIGLQLHGSCTPLKPKGPIRDLVRAGALIAAEIDRIRRRNGLVVGRTEPPAAGDARALADDRGLLPCPFCGGKASDGAVWGKETYCYAGCTKCRVFFRGEPTITNGVFGDDYAVKAVEQWNRRAHAAPPAPAREALARALYDDAEQRMGYQDDWIPWDSLDARGREKYLESAEFVAGRLERHAPAREPDEAQVERLAKEFRARLLSDGEAMRWEGLTENNKRRYRDAVSFVLRAAPPSPAVPAAIVVDRPNLRCRVCGCSEWEDLGDAAPAASEGGDRP